MKTSMKTDDELRAVLDAVPDAWATRPGCRDAAVLAPYFARDGEDFLLFTKRRDDLQNHAGQISFPGGAREPSEGPLECALRETEEEIGLPGAAVVLLGSLAPRLSSTGFFVHAIVGRIPSDLALRPDPREVEAIVSFPLAELRDPARWTIRVPDYAPDRPASPHFERDGHVLWGLTARFARELCDRLVPG